jgi:futalosine hydrolase
VALNLVVCVATELECALLQPHVRVLVTGVGAVNAAYSLTRFLEHQPVEAIINCGIGGAYPMAFERGLGVGSVVCAESECYADLGAGSPGGFLDMEALGFPVIAGPAPVYNVLPMQVFPAPLRAKFATVNSCSGQDTVAMQIEERTGAAVESMEGAAVAHVAKLYGIPCGEIRGISNRAGDRNRESWRIREAAAAAQDTLLAWLADYSGKP